MRYYVTSDIHGFYTPFTSALINSGYYEDHEDKKIVICGDLFDRAREDETIKFNRLLIQMHDNNELILVKGNHDHMIEELFQSWDNAGYFSRYFIVNGTIKTVLCLCGYDPLDLIGSPNKVKTSLEQLELVTKILPSMVNYFETKHHIFVHGWIPTMNTSNGFEYIPSWRNASNEQWNNARWSNGMMLAHEYSIKEPNKTIVCGHCAASYGHYNYEHQGNGIYEKNSNYSPYKEDGVLALDACTALSNQVNIVIIEDDPC